MEVCVDEWVRGYYVDGCLAYRKQGSSVLAVGNVAVAAVAAVSVGIVVPCHAMPPPVHKKLVDNLTKTWGHLLLGISSQIQVQYCNAVPWWVAQTYCALCIACCPA
jgi:hypothetical protein